MTERATGIPEQRVTRNFTRRSRPGGLERANREIRSALALSQRRRLNESRQRRRLQAIDRCLTTLEELHQEGALIARRDGCRKVVARLLDEVCGVPPEAVETARNSYDLHSALLDWQSAVLDDLVPHRRERFPDLNLEMDDWPRPRRRRRRSSRSREKLAA